MLRTGDSSKDTKNGDWDWGPIGREPCQRRAIERIGQDQVDGHKVLRGGAGVPAERIASPAISRDIPHGPTCGIPMPAPPPRTIAVRDPEPWRGFGTC